MILSAVKTLVPDVNSFFKMFFRLVFAISMIAVYSTAVQAQSTVNLGERVATREEIIDILKPKQTFSRKIVTRGIQLNADVAPEPPKALSLIVNFEFDSARLTPAAIRQLTPLAEALSSDELTSLSFTLEGHTDAKGTENYNLDLSHRRATAVKRFLEGEYRLHPSRIYAYGKGESELLNDGAPFSKENRRVVVIAHQ